MPAQAGIQNMKTLDPGLRRDDDKGINQILFQQIQALSQ